MEKKCKKCLTIQSIENFHKNKRRKDGHSTQCKFCRNTYERQLQKLKREHGGRLNPDLAKKAKNGWSKWPEYKCWACMKSRCSDPNYPGWNYYGGRGIKVCDRWNVFMNFYEDMGPRPTKNHTIDRIDFNKGYYPENCRWATKKQQARNRRNSTNISYNGKTKNIAEWAEELGIHSMTLRCRLRRGWSIEKVLTEPAYMPMQLKYCGIIKTIKEWEIETKIPSDCIRWRIQHGWQIKDILFKPVIIKTPKNRQ